MKVYALMASMLTSLLVLESTKMWKIHLKSWILEF